MQAKRDENYVTVGLGYDGTTTQPLLVDPVTGRLLIAIMSNVVGSPTKITKIPRDNNYVPINAAYDDTNPVPLHVDQTSGLLAIDIA